MTWAQVICLGCYIMASGYVSAKDNVMAFLWIIAAGLTILVGGQQ